MKKCIYILVLVFVLSGCSDYREVEDLTIVTAVSVDLNADDSSLLDICVEVVKIKDNTPKVTYVTATGKTYYEASSNAVKITGNDLYFSHTAVMIIGEELANKGVLEILDTIYRSSDLRLDMNLLVARGSLASEVLQTKSLIDDVAGIQIKEIIESNSLISEVPPMPVYEFIDDVTAEGVSGFLPVVELFEDNENNMRKITGVAIFKEDYIFGFLDEKQTKTMGFLKNKVQKGTVIDEYAENPSTFILSGAKSNISPEIKNDKLTFVFDIDMQLNLVQKTESFNEENDLEIMRAEIEQAVYNDFDELIKTQMEFSEVDFLGLGDLVYRKYTAEWQTLKQNFPYVIENLDYDLTVSCEIIGSGMMLNSLESQN